MAPKASTTAFFISTLLLSTNPIPVASANCPTTVSSNVAAPFVAAGFEAATVSSSLSGPRGIVFDNAGRLLVVEPGSGISALTLKDDGGVCVSVANSTVVDNDKTLNHGIEFSADGKTLWASSVGIVYQYSYDPDTATVTNKHPIIHGMFNTDHSSRTILRSNQAPNTLIINRGSQSNIDPLAAVKSSGHAQVKAFNLNKRGTKPFNFTTDGKLLAWGVRNTVGLAEHPTTGGVWGVENSVDNVMRDGIDFHNNNPGEKMNYFGKILNNKSKNQGSNFGYPQCFAAWAPAMIPKGNGIKVGQQFSINASVTDKQCQTQRTAPRLVMVAHSAPLDIKFGPAGVNAFVSLHGSHDRPIPKGFSVNLVNFKNGVPVDPSTSRTALTRLIGQQNVTGCPDAKTCLRPVSIALQKESGRLFFSSDASGELWVLKATTSSMRF